MTLPQVHSMPDSEAAVSAPVPIPPEEAADASATAPRSPPRRRLTGTAPLAARTSDVGGGGGFVSALAATNDGSAFPPADPLKPIRSADYAAPASGTGGLSKSLSGKFRRAARSEEVSAGALAMALHGSDYDPAAAGSPDSSGEAAGRARRLTGGRRLLPPRSASMERELPSSPTRWQGSAQPAMNGHYAAGEVSHCKICAPELWNNAYAC